jgi:hypothetical protein
VDDASGSVRRIDLVWMRLRGVMQAVPATGSSIAAVQFEQPITQMMLRKSSVRWIPSGRTFDFQPDRAIQSKRHLVGHWREHVVDQ